jgi:hypothetical protein
MNPNLETDRERAGVSPLNILRRFARPRPVREQCDLCGQALADEHDHLVEISTRRVHCACGPCAILFSGQKVVKYRRIPRQLQYLADFRLPDDLWARLDLPIELAFFVRDTATDAVIVRYPSPAGTTEAIVNSNAWKELVDENPSIQHLEPDVEVLLVNRIGGRCECYRVGIDEGYKLVGILRQHWQGFSGGREVWDEIDRFFEDLKHRSS